MPTDNHRITTIYGLYSTSNKDEIKYIGQTTCTLKRRLSGHIKIAKHLKTKKDIWIYSELSKGFEVKILEIKTNAIWDKTEIEVIADFKSCGSNLVNTLSGGSGSRDYPQELKNKISDTVKQLWNSKEYRENRVTKKGVTWSQSRRESHNNKTKEQKTESGKKSLLKMTKEQVFNRASIAAKALWEQRRSNGTDRGVNCNGAKLNDILVYEMRVKHKAGMSFVEIAKQYGVSSRGASKAIKGETWAHVAQP